MKNLWRTFSILLIFELKITMRHVFSWLTPLLFFIIVTSLFPLSISPDKMLLNHIAGGIIWIAVLLAILLSIGNIFRSDDEEGFFDILFTSTTSPTLFVLSKVVAHWLTHALPLILISPVFAILLGVSYAQFSTLIISLLLGTPVLSLFGTLGAALTVGIRGQNLLLPILIMPLFIPVLIFGTSALLASSQHEAIGAYYAILAALFFVSLGLTPWLSALALRISQS